MTFLANIFASKTIQLVCLLTLCTLLGAGTSAYYVSDYYDAKIDVINAEYAKNIAESDARSAKIVVKETIIYENNVQKIEEKEKEILDKTDEELKDEKNACVIGPNFIRLHNDAASAVPETQ